MDARSQPRSDASRDDPAQTDAAATLALCVRGERVEVVVRPDATLSDLAELLGFDADAPLAADGRPVARSMPVRDAGLSHGSELAEPSAARAAHRDHGAPVARVGVVAGTHAGLVWDVPAGDHVVGAAASADLRIMVPGIARHQALARVGSAGEVRWLDLTGTVPVAPDEAGVCRVGTVLLRCTPAPRAAGEESVPAPAPGRWTVPWLRPVPRAAPTPIEPVRLPPPIERPAPAGPLGLATLVTPLAVGVVAMAVLRQPMLLLLGGAAALASLVPRLVQVARAGRANRRSLRVADAALQRFADDLDRHRRAVTARAWTEEFDVVAALAVCAHPDDRLWSRRLHAPDAFVVTLGVGSRSERPSLEPPEGPAADDPAMWALVEAASELVDVPLPIALGPGAVIGIAGDVAAARAVARAIVVQLGALHGPADLVLTAFSDVSPSTWEWMRWLPHARDAGTEHLDTTCRDRHVVLVVDGPGLMGDPTSAPRQLLDGGRRSVAAIVIGGDPATLPARCTTVIEVRADGGAVRRTLASPGVPERLVIAGLAEEDAARAARQLARFEDPELASEGEDLPPTVGLHDVIAPTALEPSALVASWRANEADPRPTATLGLCAQGGPVEIDLVRDGPHVLVAGTTGSGKSELLRTLVVGLAAGQAPEHLTFVLVDYKGGSAFDACADLPHVVGTVTDLEPGSADRVLRSLGAELVRRERILRDAGAPDLTAHRRRPDHEPIPRLVVVVDEFATLATDHPSFLGSLVAVAQRGRSLGIHLVLATQRPAGVVSDDIRANTNLRISLRVQDPADSVEVLGDPAAAALPRTRPGRALIRYGAGDLVPLQVACVSVPLPGVDPPQVAYAGRVTRSGEDQPTALSAAVDAIRRAAHAAGSRPPRRPWTDPLPAQLPIEDVPPGAIGLIDDVGGQRHLPLTWDRSAGHLVIVGPVGSGATTTIVTASLAAATAHPPDRLHLYGVDHGAGGLAPLVGLPHTGAVIGATERERQLRLVRRLGHQLDARRAGTIALPPELLVVVDDLVGWRRGLDEVGEHDAVATLDRILAGGPEVGIVVAVSATSDAGLPRALDGTVGSCLTLGQLQRGGVGGTTAADVVPGRALEVRSDLVVQIADHGPVDCAVAAIARRWAGIEVEPAPEAVGTLPSRVELGGLPPPRAAGTSWLLPVGIDDATLDPAVLALHRGDHLLVSGPNRSGRTSTLTTLAHQLAGARPDVAIACIGFRDRPPAASVVHDLDELVALDPRHLVVVVDDAELVDDPHGVLTALVGGRDAIVVAGGRADALRSAYGHWTAHLRRQRRGIVLCPTADVDGDVIGTVLPRRDAAGWAPGRGYLVVDGETRLVQVALAGAHLDAVALEDAVPAVVLVDPAEADEAGDRLVHPLA